MKRRFLALLLIAGPAWAGDTQAPPTEEEKWDELVRPQSRLEWGAGTARGNTFLGGNFVDLKPEFGILNFEWRSRQMRLGNPDDDHVRWRVEGRDLGLAARSLQAEWGQLNVVRVGASHDRMVRHASDTFQTPYEGAGTSVLRLPANFVRGADTGGMRELANSLTRWPIESTRNRNELTATWWPDPDWEISARWRHETQEGLKVRRLEFGGAPQVGRSTPLPEPVDTVTQLIDFTASYTGEAERFSFGYHASLFDNRADPLVWQNAYSSTPFTGANSGLPPGFPIDTGRAGKVPDNRLQRIDAQGIWDFSNTTRLALTLRRGRATQNDLFLPYSINAGLLNSPLPRPSLNGIIDTTFAFARLTLRPQRGLNLSATLKFDQRDNRTPISEFAYAGGDAEIQPVAGSASDDVRRNLPRSRQNLNATVEADWRLSPSSALKGGWEVESISRRFSEVETTREQTIRLDLRHTGSSLWVLNAGLAASMRRGTDYLANSPFVSSHSAALIESLLRAGSCTVPVDCVRAGPFQTKHFLADRNRHLARGIVGHQPGGPWSWLVRAEAARDNYPHTPFGRERNGRWTVNADLNWQPENSLGATLFVTRDQQSVAQRTRQIGVTGAINPVDADWTHDTHERTWTVGSTFKWSELAGGRLAMEASALAVRGSIEELTRAGPAAPASQNPSSPLPDTRYQALDTRFTATWRMDRATQWKLQASHRRIKQSDWAFANLGASTLPNLVGSLEQSPDYGVRVLRLSWVRTFR